MTSSPAICVIGAGQLGSRHLQALQSIPSPLLIHVIDPSPESLARAKERFDSLPRTAEPHTVTYGHSVADVSGPVDVAIIATNSDHRREAVEALLAHTPVRFMVLEKILFRKPQDYPAVSQLLNEKNVIAFVNCSMRTMPFYFDMKSFIGSGPISYTVTASQFGLITNAIHYIDHMSYLVGTQEYRLVTDGLDPRVIKSKRPGFLELNGTLGVEFSDGSHGSFTCFSSGATPVLVEVASDNYRCVSRETEQKAWVCSAQEEWKWKEVAAVIPFQSMMTTSVVTQLLAAGTCPLVPFNQSVVLHLPLLDGLQKFLNERTGQVYVDYPFT